MSLKCPLATFLSPVLSWQVLVVAVTAVRVLRRRFASDDDDSPLRSNAAESHEDAAVEGQPFPAMKADPSWLQKSPVDEPHPNKWEPPLPDGSPSVPPGREEEAKEWMAMEMATFQTAFDHHSRRTPSKVAVTWVGLDCEPQREMTYADLQAQTCAIAVWLREKRGVKEGDRVMLVYPPGLDFLTAFLGCLRAGEEKRER